jgi:hypothetical protein
MVEVPLTIERLPVLFRQRDYGFFPSWMYVVNITLLELPLGLIDTFLWTIVVYWLVGMTATAGQYVDWNQVGNSKRFGFHRFFVFWAIMYGTFQVPLKILRCCMKLASTP